MSSLQTHILTGFDDPRLSPEDWTRLLAQGDTDVIFLTRQYLRAWWETLGEGELLLILAEREGTPVTLAPLYATGGMICFAATDSADYLDFIGDTGDPEVLPALLTAARARLADFLGFKFYFIPEQSRTAEFAWYYRGTHFSAPWCFAMAEAKYSPGHVLLRQSLLAARAAGLHTYDLGIGDQEYKFRLPVHTINCQTWGLYPSD